MAMPAPSTAWTVEMVHALPDDGNRYEVIDGELFVTPAPSPVHQRAVRELLYIIGPYVTAHAIGDALMAPADVVYGPRKMVQPDLFVLPLVGGAPPRTWMEVGHLILVAGVLSPSTRRADRGKKRDLYQDKGVPEYWVVDLDDRLVERWRPNEASPETLTERLEWRPDRLVEPLDIDLRAYFTRVHGQ